MFNPQLHTNETKLCRIKAYNKAYIHLYEILEKGNVTCRNRSLVGGAEDGRELTAQEHRGPLRGEGRVPCAGHGGPTDTKTHEARHFEYFTAHFDGHSLYTSMAIFKWSLQLQTSFSYIEQYCAARAHTSTLA